MVKLLKKPIRFSFIPCEGAMDKLLLLRLRYLEEKNMTNEKIKDMSIYIFIMHMMENCEELNEIVKNDLKEIKKYFNKNLNIEVKNVAFDAN